MAASTDAYIVGIFEHPTRHAIDRSVPQLHADVALGALGDAGLTVADVDSFFCSGDSPGMGPLSMAEYLGLRPRHMDSSDIGGATNILHVGHAAQAIAAGKADIALVTLAGRPKAVGMSTGTAPRFHSASAPEVQFEFAYGAATVNTYAMVAARHMHEFGTTLEDLAWIKYSASQHAQHNPNAMIRKAISLEDIRHSPRVADPLRRHDCCVISDGGGALVIANAAVALSLNQPLVRIRGTGEALKHMSGGEIDLTYSAAAWSGSAAFSMANVTPADIDYASLYDSFTITLLMQLEDLGFCQKGEGGKFVRDGNLIAGVGKLPVNTDGGGLCNNHPANRGGMTKVIEAVRQLRGQAHPAVQVPDCRLALAQGIGGSLGTRHGAATAILERE